MLNGGNGKFLLGLVHDALKEINIDHWFISGTCLGLVREGNVIHDDADIDIAIPYSSNDNLQPILHQLHRVGMNQVSCMEKNGKYENIGLNREGDSFELDFLHTNDSHSWITWFENGRSQWCYLVYPKEMFNGHDTINGFPVPRNPTEFVRMTYGNDWAIPNPNYYKSNEGFYLMGKEARRYEFNAQE